MSDLLAYLLGSMGLTVLIVWPDEGPSAWIRERILRRILPGKARQILDCYICLSFWTSLMLSPAWWYTCREFWCWFGCLMTPALFWLVLRPGTSSERSSSEANTDES